MGKSKKKTGKVKKKSNFVVWLILGIVLSFSIYVSILSQTTVQSSDSTYSSPKTTLQSAKSCVVITDDSAQPTSIGPRVVGIMRNKCSKDLDSVTYTLEAYGADGKLVDVLANYNPCKDGYWGIDALGTCPFRTSTVKGMSSYRIFVSEAEYR